jgi:hypothetical protein
MAKKQLLAMKMRDREYGGWISYTYQNIDLATARQKRR